MTKLSDFDRLQSWNKAETFLKKHFSEYKIYHYSDSWPERLTIDELAALQAADAPDTHLTWKSLIVDGVANGEIPVIVDSVRTVAGSGERSAERKNTSGSWVFPIIFEAPNMKLETISPFDFDKFLKPEVGQASECIRDWFDAFGVEYISPAVGNAGTGSQGDDEKTLSEELQARLNNIRDYMSFLTSAAQAKDVVFSPMQLPLTKEQLLEELKKRYKGFNIKIDAFELVWTAATRAGICASSCANIKNGKSFLKSVIG